MGKQKLKSPELMKARDALIKFLKNNGLNPAKDYSKHPKYGQEYRRLLLKLQVERDKLVVNYPNSDIKNRKKYFAMKKDKEKKAKAAKAAAAQETVKVEKVKKEKKAKAESTDKAPRVCKYDYPLVDGREMTASEKKKYRAEQRKAASGGTEKPAKPAKEKKAKKEKETTTSGKEVSSGKAKSKKDKKAAKAKKVED